MTSRSLRIAPVLALAAVILAACAPSGDDNREHSLALVSPGGDRTVHVQVEVADTVDARVQGLMGRESLDANRGMLFVFPEADILSFWMRNTLIPLDIMFFGTDGEFINAFEMHPCEEDPCPQYRSAALAQYALEVNAGFREENGISTGWKIDPAQLAKISRHAE